MSHTSERVTQMKSVRARERRRSDGFRAAAKSSADGLAVVWRRELLATSRLSGPMAEVPAGDGLKTVGRTSVSWKNEHLLFFPALFLPLIDIYSLVMSPK